jgi:hypothetical protein
MADPYVVIKIQDRLAGLPEEDYRFVETFLTKNPDLKDDVNLWLGKEDQEEKQKEWEHKITEIRLWLRKDDQIDIRYMYRRTLELSKSFRARKPIFDEKPVGRLTDDDIISIINRIRHLWKLLCYRIYPDLEAYFSYESYRKEEKRPDCRGMIDWPKTIINSSNTAGGVLEFVCKIPERRFDTPENLLLMVAVNWLQRDAKIVRAHSGFPKLTQEEKKLVQRVYSITDKIFHTTSLQKILDKAKQLSEKKFDSIVIKNLMENSEYSVRKRIDIGIIQNQNYIELLRWATSYIYFDVDKIQHDLKGVKMDTEEGLTRMYEYWLLYEFAAFLETEKQLKCMPGVSNLHFVITKNKKRIKLLFNKPVYHEQLQTRVPGQYLKPDYQIETYNILPNGKYLKTVIMDAKLYLESDLAGASNKMLRYIVEILLKKPQPERHYDGVLLVPVLSRNFKTEPFESPDATIITCLICPSQELGKMDAMRENFGKIYEEFLKPHLE